jgi:hypothetical protein
MNHKTNIVLKVLKQLIDNVIKRAINDLIPIHLKIKSKIDLMCKLIFLPFNG